MYRMQHVYNKKDGILGIDRGKKHVNKQDDLYYINNNSY